MKDLTELNRDIEEVFKKHGLGIPAFIVAFQTPNEQKVFWVSNTKRTDSILLLDHLSERMKSQRN
jgi:hypothetical protein